MGNKNQSIDREWVKVVKEIDTNLIENIEKPLSYGYGVRHLQTLIFFFALNITFISRAHMSATIIAMSDVPKHIAALKYDKNISETEILENFADTYINNNEFSNCDYFNITDEDFIALNNHTLVNTHNISHNEQDSTKNVKMKCESKRRQNFTQEFVDNSTSGVWNVFKVYAWPKSTQEMVLGSYFLGHLIMTTPMGMVVQRWGGKLPLQIALFSAAVITFFTPWLAIWGDYKVVAISRVAMGMAQSGVYPSLQILIGKWVPVRERGRLVTYIYSGGTIGTISSLYLAGFLLVSHVGWPLVFWVVGILCMVMALVVTWFVAPTPQQHRSISEEEKNFILGGVKAQVKRHSTPWKSMMFSKPVWALFFAHVGATITYWFMFAQIPTYLHHAVGLNIKNSGLLSSVPYLAMFVTSISMGFISDYCINNKIVSMKLFRIISTSLATVVPAFAMFSLTYITSPALVIGCLTFCMAAFAGSHTGWMVNYIEVSPNFSGSLMATGNSIMNIFVLINSLLVSKIVIDVTNLYQWRIVLFVVGGLALVCNTVYIFFMSADVQPWNDPEYRIADQEDPDIKKDNTVTE